MIIPILFAWGAYAAYRFTKEQYRKYKISAMIKENKKNWDFIGTCIKCWKKYKVPTDSYGFVDPDGSYLCSKCEGEL